MDIFNEHFIIIQVFIYFKFYDALIRLFLFGKYYTNYTEITKGGMICVRK